MSNVSQVRQNFHFESEAGINKQINLQLHAFNVYLQLSQHFTRDDISLPGFHKFFETMSDKKKNNSDELIELQNMRGGRVVLHDIQRPFKQQWSTGLEAMEAALELEKTINQSLLDLTAISNQHNDPQMRHFLESRFLNQQVNTIKNLADYVTILRMVGHGLGEYLFDKNTLR